MRKFSILAIIVAVLSIATIIGASQDNPRRDGNWWRTQSELPKTAYLTGFFDGMILGRNFSYWKFTASKQEEEQVAMVKAMESYSEYSQKYMADVTSGQLRDGLDELYTDYRNRKITLSDGVWLVLNSISGKSKQEMEIMIENFRKNAG